MKTKKSKLRPEVIEAIEEAERILKDPNTKSYDSFSELLKDIEEN